MNIKNNINQLSAAELASAYIDGEITPQELSVQLQAISSEEFKLHLIKVQSLRETIQGQKFRASASFLQTFQHNIRLSSALKSSHKNVFQLLQLPFWQGMRDFAVAASVCFVMIFALQQYNNWSAVEIPIATVRTQSPQNGLPSKLKMLSPATSAVSHQSTTLNRETPETVVYKAVP